MKCKDCDNFTYGKCTDKGCLGGCEADSKNRTVHMEQECVLTKCLIWSEENDQVFGAEREYETTHEFIEAIKHRYRKMTDKECNVSNVRLEPCILTESGLPSEMLIPLRLTDIEISNYYAADVEELCSDDMIPSEKVLRQHDAIEDLLSDIRKKAKRIEQLEKQLATVKNGLENTLKHAK